MAKKPSAVKNLGYQFDHLARQAELDNLKMQNTELKAFLGLSLILNGLLLALTILQGV